MSDKHGPKLKFWIFNKITVLVSFFQLTVILIFFPGNHPLLLNVDVDVHGAFMQLTL